MASIAEMKSALLQYVAQTDDEKILKKMQEYFASLIESEKKVIAYSAAGEPLTIESYNASIQEAIDQYKSGKTISQKEMEKRPWTKE